MFSTISIRKSCKLAVPGMFEHRKSKNLIKLAAVYVNEDIKP